MAVVYVNDKPVDLGGERLNLIQAAERAGVLIPHYCWHPALSVVASCRMCLVEVGEKKPDGTIAMQPKVVPACQTPAKDGTVVVTNSEKAKAAQAQTLEGILLNHPLDCPVCDKAGECKLQDYSYRFGRAQTRMIDEKNTPPNKPHISDSITLFTDRCVMCSRCVRFTREISGQAELQIINRGHHAEIDIFPGEPLNNPLAGNVVDLCPVGALGSKDFLYKQRVWFLKTQESVCPDCSTGCSIYVDANKDVTYRLRPRPNAKAQGDFMCDLGRHGYHYVNSRERLTQTFRRGSGSGKDAGRSESYEEILVRLRRELKAAAAEGVVAAVLSPYLTCEEAFLLAEYIKSLGSNTRLVLGHVPVIGEDDTYPKNRRGLPIHPIKFTIRAEKCPNRRGVEAVLRHFQREVHSLDEILRLADSSQLAAIYITAGYPPQAGTWLNDGQLDVLRKLPLVIVQDLLPGPASSAAHYVLPAAAFTEKDGTYVNHAGLAQALHWAVRPPAGVRTDGQVFLDLLERRGLAHVKSIRRAMAQSIPYFAPLADGEIGKQGIMLAITDNQGERPGGSAGQQ